MKKLTTQKRFNLVAKKTSYAMCLLTCVAFFCAMNPTLAHSTDLITKNLGTTSGNKINFLLEYKADLDAIENYLNNIKNLTAKFVQKSQNGLVEGKFYLSRPGKMRVEYVDQPKVLIVVNGSVLSYKDLELDEVSNIGTNTTPASFLTRPNISFSAKDVDITSVIKTAESITVSVIKKNRTEAGEFSLTFKTSPALGFAKMEVKNDLGEKTTVSLREVNFPETINDNLFVIRNTNLPF